MRRSRRDSPPARREDPLAGIRDQPLAASALFLTAVVVAVFPDVIRGERVFFYRDIHAYWYPAIEVFVRAVARGELPLWNPHFGFGEPLLANPSFQLAYPPTWLNLLLPPSAYYALFVLAHLVAGGLGMVRLADRLEVSPLAALLAGTVWCASGPVLSSVSLWHHFAGAAWIPWVLLVLDRALAAPGPGSGLALGAVAAGQSLAGSADMCVMSAIAGGIWIPCRARRGKGLPLLFALLVSLIFAFCLGAVQWLPALDVLAGSVRAGYAGSASTYWSVHPLRVAELASSAKLGLLPLSAAARELLFHGREPFLSSLYLGVVPGVFALAALLPGGPAPRLLRAGMALGLGLSLVAALGRHIPLYEWALRFPPVAVLRYPVKFMLLAVVFWSLLAAVGFERWRRSGARSTAWMAPLVVAVGIAAAVSGGVVPPRLPEGWFTATGRPDALAALRQAALVAAASLISAGALLVARRKVLAQERLVPLGLIVLAGADLVWSGRAVNPLARPELLTHRPPILDALPDRDATRVFVEVPPRSWLIDQLARGPEGWATEPRWALGAIEMLRPPIAARFGIDGSYDGDLTGLMPAWRLPLEARARAPGEGSLRLLQRSAITHVVTVSERPRHGLRPVGEWASVFSTSIRLAELPGALPRAFAVDGVRVASGPTAYELLTSADFDAEREVVLAGGPPRAPGPGFVGRVELAARSPNRVVLEATVSGPGYVVLLDAFDRGWSALVDGAPAELLRANVAFRAVAVHAGAHRVELRYAPRVAAIGAGLSAGAALFGSAYSASRRRRA